MNNQPDERSVYLALNNVIRGTDAQLRKQKKIREFILKQQTNANVKALIESHNIDDVCNVVRSLLEQQVFESTLKAKIRFPEVFEVSPAQSAERSASEKEAARSEADAIQVAVGGSSRLDEDVHVSGRAPAKRRADDFVAGPSAIVPDKRTHSAIATPTSLYPVYLPFQTQHKLLVLAQETLERACYDFTIASMPELIKSEGWDCAEALELNIWTRKMESREDKFLAEDVAELGKPFNDLLDTVAQIRHTAVHRLRISANRIGLYLQDAESLSRLLHDRGCLQSLSRLRRETHLAIEDLKGNKDLLESQLAVKMKDITARRAELDRLEGSVVADMMREDQEYAQLVGKSLLQTVNFPDTTIHSISATEHDHDSDTEVARCSVMHEEVDVCRDDWVS
ncbi:hypothetical protein LTR64_003765 [Lithohypha guttulata]|uniref:uncharacterized protein n=1 Tax=Lithohypha guttulata TaxID=1690604 RepID=UPI002DE0FFEF|nr:hypothetical protein LTR51_000014 [Lithohypha guttulata]